MSNPKAPYQVLSDDNRGPLITIVSITFLIASFIFVAAKLASEIYFNQRRPIVNTPIWIALILSIIEIVFMQKAVENGLGKHIDTLTLSAIRQSSKFAYTAQLILVVVVSLSKLSTTLLLWNLTPSKTVHQACIVTMGLITAWTAFALFAIAFQCQLPEPWLYTPDRCSTMLIYPVTVCHILIELIIMAIPFLMIRNLHMARSKRIKILCSFAARIAHVSLPVSVIGLAIAQLAVLPPFLYSPDTTWTFALPTICGQAMMCTAVTVACLPTLYHVFAGFHSGLLTTRLPDEMELARPKRNTYGCHGRKTVGGLYPGALCLNSESPSMVTDISSSRKNRNAVGRRSVSDSAGSMRHLTQVSTQEGVLKTVDITVEVQESRR
ncbi:hypothetical protein BDV28DRAFT_150521 [Aspergillus coremiiformis]|uniref:Rhodopsin domain-containing protein n=1 Tax=Aspergillus coremiiformis TaxID=138285 RepID=A0A5N6Z4F5_9EURO|nr:hypothetical protein BDV28DRAFT_150521 [Aspergillus coremiiformis]